MAPYDVRLFINYAQKGCQTAATTERDRDRGLRERERKRGDGWGETHKKENGGREGFAPSENIRKNQTISNLITRNNIMSCYDHLGLNYVSRQRSLLIT